MDIIASIQILSSVASVSPLRTHRMLALKGQPGWTHVFGPTNRAIRWGPHPYARKPIHKRWNFTKLRSNLTKLLHEYCSNSTIHGINYIDSQRSILERFWWLVVFVLSIYGCGSLIQNVYHKWDDHPVIVTFDERPVPVWQIPFPAVTICPGAKIRADSMNFTDAFFRFAHPSPEDEELDRDSLDQLMVVMQLCDSFFYAFRRYTSLFEHFKSDLNVVSILEQISVSLNETFKMCRTCDNLFYNTITEEGICFTYNGFSAQDMFRSGVLHSEYEYLSETKQATNWSAEDGYVAGSSLNSHPARALDSGFGARLTFPLMTSNKDIEHHCREEQGFKIVLHSPDEYPQVTKNFFLLTLGRDMNIAVRPQIIRTSSELRNYSPERRQCFFNHERPLRFFRSYTQRNCALECLTNFTLETCGCVKFHMPRSEGTRLCQTADIQCVLLAEKELQDQSAFSHVTNSDHYQSDCNCMPACSSIHYDAEITQSAYDFQRTWNVRFRLIFDSRLDYLSEKQISKLGIYFKEEQFFISRRNELFGLTDFIANCGGILGLCMGMSLFSLVELLYYVCIRPMLLIRSVYDVDQNIIMVRTSTAARY